MEINSLVKKYISDRIDEGNVTFGKQLNTKDSRDFIDEAIEELLDACIYLTVKLFQIRETHGNLRMDEICNKEEMRKALEKVMLKSKKEVKNGTSKQSKRK